MKKVLLDQCNKCHKLFDANGFHTEASRNKGLCKTCQSKIDKKAKVGKPKERRADKDSLEFLAEMVE